MIDLLIAEAPFPGAQWRGQRRLGGGGSADPTLLDLALDASGAGFAWSGALLNETAPPALSSANALLLNFVGVAAEAEEEFNAWYDGEHVPRLAALPGVRRVARFRSASHDPSYLALYELAAPAVAEGPAWLQAARTPWTARMKRFTRNYRSYLFARLTPEGS